VTTCTCTALVQMPVNRGPHSALHESSMRALRATPLLLGNELWKLRPFRLHDGYEFIGFGAENGRQLFRG